MKRFFTELFNPKLKCERLGHKTKTATFTVRKKCYERHAVVTDHTATQEHCTRCGEKGPMIIGDQTNWFSSCSMPQHMWDEMTKDGFTILPY